MIKVKKDWWKDFFNEVYLITDSRSVCNNILTQREVDLIERVLDLNKNDRILDLCGGHGRHSLELAKRGYKDLTVLDYSKYLIALGRKLAKKASAKIEFHQADARFSKLKDSDYSCIILMANSFGYFPDEKYNLLILKEIHRLLKDKGKLLLDLADSDYVKNNLEPFSWHRANRDIIVTRRREFKRGFVRAREIVISRRKGLIRDGTYCERIYDKEKITRSLKDLGFRMISVKKNLSLHERKQDYGFLSSRMIVTANK